MNSYSGSAGGTLLEAGIVSFESNFRLESI
jgi:hypothetical protein